MKPFALPLALVLAASSAVAQPIIADHAQRAPSPEVAPAAEAPLAVPDLPTVPPELAARVTALRAVVDQTQDCFTYHGERDEHIADRRCPGWFAALTRGGPAGAHAIGAMLDRDFRDREIDYGNVGEGGWVVRPRLVRLMTTQGGPAATTYLLRYLGRALETDNRLSNETARAALDTLATLAGEDLTRVAPWEDQDTAFRDDDRVRGIVQRWLRWQRDVSGLPRAQQLALAQRSNVESLTSPDPARRWGAIQRLMAVPAQRAAATASLRELVANPALTAEGRGFLTRWARRQGVPVAAPRAALAAR